MLAGDDGDRVKIYDEDGGKQPGTEGQVHALLMYLDFFFDCMTARYRKPLRMVFQNTMI